MEWYVRSKTFDAKRVWLRQGDYDEVMQYDQKGRLPRGEQRRIGSEGPVQ